jgi:hypothetical protein
MTLEGYWVAMVIEGEGYLGRLCSHDHVLLYPATEEDVEKITEAQYTTDNRTKEVKQPGPDNHLIGATVG